MFSGLPDGLGTFGAPCCTPPALGDRPFVRGDFPALANTASASRIALLICWQSTRTCGGIGVFCAMVCLSCSSCPTYIRMSASPADVSSSACASSMTRFASSQAALMRVSSLPHAAIIRLNHKRRQSVPVLRALTKLVFAGIVPVCAVGRVTATGVSIPDALWPLWCPRRAISAPKPITIARPDQIARRSPSRSTKVIRRLDAGLLPLHLFQLLQQNIGVFQQIRNHCQPSIGGGIASG